MKLIKEIRDKNGKLYFKRWRLFSLPNHHVEIHKFWQAADDPRYDKDKDPHNHPHEFWSLILWGGYLESYAKHMDYDPVLRVRRVSSLEFVNKEYFHYVVTLIQTTCVTLILKKKERDDNWGYLVRGEGSSQNFLNHEEYRANKNPEDNNQ